MAFTLLTPIAPGTGWATSGSTITWTAGDATNGNSFISTGREILHCKNTDGSNPHTLVITSQPDTPAARSGASNNFSQAIPASGEICTPMLPKAGWADANSLVEIPAMNADLSFWVETVPA